MSNNVMIRVRAPRACFRRPEFSRDLVTYPVIPPWTAQRLLSNFGKTTVKVWRIDGIEVLTPIRYCAPFGHFEGRQIIALSEVDYVLHAHLRDPNLEIPARAEVHLGLHDLPGEAFKVDGPIPSRLDHNERDADFGWLPYELQRNDKKTPTFCRAVMRGGFIDIASARDELAI